MSKTLCFIFPRILCYTFYMNIVVFLSYRCFFLLSVFPSFKLSVCLFVLCLFSMCMFVCLTLRFVGSSLGIFVSFSSFYASLSLAFLFLQRHLIDQIKRGYTNTIVK